MADADDNETLGEVVRNLRKEKHLTQAALARAVGVDESYISKIEANKLSYTPSEETLRLIARETDSDPLRLLSLAKKAPEEMKAIAHSEQAREFFSLLRGNRVETDDWEDLTNVLRHRLSKRNR